eukprot:SAG31_NODE_7968_length_1552_cov_1.866483_2_plen_155_part_00
MSSAFVWYAVAIASSIASPVQCISTTPMAEQRNWLSQINGIAGQQGTLRSRGGPRGRVPLLVDRSHTVELLETSHLGPGGVSFQTLSIRRVPLGSKHTFLCRGGSTRYSINGSKHTMIFWRIQYRRPINCRLTQGWVWIGDLAPMSGPKAETYR